MDFQLCPSPSIMSVPTYHVCPPLLCPSPPIMSAPTHNFFADKPFLNLDRLGNIGVCLECFSSVFGRGLEGSMVSLRKGHFQKMFRNLIFATLGSILDFQLCPSPSIMSVPTYYVCPHLSCLSPPITSVPTYYFVLVWPQPSFFC